jgi:hypothetical protein
VCSVLRGTYEDGLGAIVKTHDTWRATRVHPCEVSDAFVACRWRPGFRHRATVRVRCANGLSIDGPGVVKNLGRRTPPCRPRW